LCHQALSSSSHRCLSRLQAEHEKFKGEAEARVASAAAEASELRAALDAAQAEAATAQRAQREATAALHTKEEELAAERAKAQVNRMFTFGIYSL
jgi:hypothetical protein